MTEPEHDASSKHRLFVAIPIPEPVKAEVVKLQKELQTVAPDEGIRWLRPDQFHLTLKFLGNVDPARLEALTAATREACRIFGPLRLRAEQVGFFPHERRLRVLWVGIRCETEDLQALQASVDLAVMSYAEKTEVRDFTAHLTMARIRSLNSLLAQTLVARIGAMTDRTFGEWTADKVEVIRSELLPEGSRYTCLAEIPLCGV